MTNKEEPYAYSAMKKRQQTPQWQLREEYGTKCKRTQTKLKPEGREHSHTHRLGLHHTLPGLQAVLQNADELLGSGDLKILKQQIFLTHQLCWNTIWVPDPNLSHNGLIPNQALIPVPLPLMMTCTSFSERSGIQPMVQPIQCSRIVCSLYRSLWDRLFLVTFMMSPWICVTPGRGVMAWGSTTTIFTSLLFSSVKQSDNKTVLVLCTLFNNTTY